MAQGIGAAPAAGFVLLLNADVRFEAGTVRSLIDFARDHPEAAVVAAAFVVYGMWAATGSGVRGPQRSDRTRPCARSVSSTKPSSSGALRLVSIRAQAFRNQSCSTGPHGGVR